jgi:lipid A disaccharide synthetase
VCPKFVVSDIFIHSVGTGTVEVQNNQGPVVLIYQTGGDSSIRIKGRLVKYVSQYNIPGFGL